MGALPAVMPGLSRDCDCNGSPNVPMVAEALETRPKLLRSASTAAGTELLCPHIDKIPDAGCRPLHPFTQFAAEHAAFRRRCAPWLLDEDQKESIDKAATKDLKAVQLCFPNVLEKETVLCMAAWFFVLITVDDMIEALPVDAALETLHACQGLFTDRGNTEKDSQVKHIFETLQSQILAMARSQTRTELFAALESHIQGLIAEANHRQNPLKDIEEYMAIRVQTIGMAPFFALLDTTTNKSAQLKQLADLVTKVAGLQNDIVGLKKDIKEKWHMNLVLVAAKEDILNAFPLEKQLELAQPYIEFAQQMHDATIDEAVSVWEDIQLSHSSAEKALSDALIGFIEPFLFWAASSKRYIVE